MEALYRKYRPSTFGDVSGQEHVKTVLLNQIAAEQPAHAYLLTGPRGVGKTTVARLIAKAVNCLKPKNGEPCNACEACLDIQSGASLDVQEIDAASQTKVEETRENIIESVRFSPNRLKYKVYIIDEVHMLSTASFNALLKTLEEPPAHALFVLATTEIHKVPATIISRCQRFDFRRLTVDAIVARLKEVVKEEKVKVDDDVLQEIARHADGGLRDAESMLGQVLGLGEGKITMVEASLVLPATNGAMVDAFIAAVLSRDAKEAIRLVNDGLEQGVDLPHFTEDVVSTLRDKMMSTVSAELVPLIESFLDARRQMKTSKIVQLPLELAIVKACGVQSVPKAEARRVDSVVVIPDPVRVSPPAKGESGGGTVVTPIPTSATIPDPILALAEPDPIEPVATVLGDVPVLDLEDVRRRWPEVFQQIKDCNATLPMVVQTGELSAVDGDAIEMTFNYAVYVEAINQDKNRKLLEQVFARVLGRSVKVKAKYVKKEIDQAVENLIDAFGGSVV